MGQFLFQAAALFGADLVGDAKLVPVYAFPDRRFADAEHLSNALLPHTSFVEADGFSGINLFVGRPAPLQGVA